MNDADRADTRSLDRGLTGAALGAVLALSVAACLRKIWAADFWWQHAAGRYVAEHGWPTLDVFSYTAGDHPWMELRWLFCLAQYRVEQWSGPGGLIVLKWLAVVAAFALVGWPVYRRGSNALTLAAVWTVALLASSQRFFVRPELVTYVLIGLFVWVLDRYRVRGGRALFALPLLQVVWVNAHPLFVFGPLLVGLLLTVTIARFLFSAEAAEARTLRLSQMRTLAGVLAATALACLINPYGVQGALHPFLLFSEMRGSVFSEAIGELRSPFAFGWDYSAVVWYQALIGLCLLSAAVNLRRLDPFWTLFCLTQFYLSTLSIRNLPFFCLAAVPFIVSNLDRSVLLGRPGWKRGFVVARRAVALAVVAVCAVYAWLMVTDRMSVRQNDSNQFGLGIASHRYPVKTVDFVRAQPPGGRVFATLLESSYLTARDIEVFADPRLEVYGEALFSRYLAAQSSAAAWRQAVADFDIRTALVGLQSGLAAYLHTATEWKLVDFDSVAAVWVRRDSPAPAIGTDADYAKVLEALRAELPRARPYGETGLLERVTIPKPYLALADFLLAAGRAELAVEWLDDARAAGPFLDGLAERQSRLSELSRDWSDVVRHARAALRETPDDPRLMVRIGEALFRLNRYAEAGEWLTRSLEGLPDRALTWSTLGRIHLAGQDLREAERCFRRAAELSPGEAIYHSSLARVQALAGRRVEAIAGLERARSLDPRNATILRDLAQLYLLEGDEAAARAALDQGLRFDPGNRELLNLQRNLKR